MDIDQDFVQDTCEEFYQAGYDEDSAQDICENVVKDVDYFYGFSDFLALSMDNFNFSSGKDFRLDICEGFATVSYLLFLHRFLSDLVYAWDLENQPFLHIVLRDADSEDGVQNTEVRYW